MTLTLPSAMLERITLELDEGETVGEWIESRIKRALEDRRREHHETRPATVELAPEMWERIRLDALTQDQAGPDGFPLYDTLAEYVEIVPAPHIEGNPSIAVDETDLVRPVDIGNAEDRQ